LQTFVSAAPGFSSSPQQKICSDPNTFLLDHLLQLKPVKFLEGELIHDLLTIFVSQKLEAYTRFYESHKLVFIFLFFPIFNFLI
jgi:hypothetical protein